MLVAEETQKVILVGAGGNCEALLDILVDLPFKPVGVLDGGLDAGSNIFGMPVLGDDALAPKLFSEGVRYAIITVAAPCALRQKLTGQYREMGFIVPSLISPHAFVSSYATVHEGATVFPGANIGAGSCIAQGATINANAVVSHGVEVGAFSHVAPNATLLGNVVVASCVLVGAGSVVLPGVHIGPLATVGAGSVVLSDVAEHCVVVGNPAGTMNRHENS